MKKQEQYKYYAWLSDKDSNPIEGSDRIISGPSKRWILEMIAYENKVEHLHNSPIVRLPNGDVWCVRRL